MDQDIPREVSDSFNLLENWGEVPAVGALHLNVSPNTPFAHSPVQAYLTTMSPEIGRT
jgi:hypothetical protein